ncbi:unnamed protein product [Gordionus sp. m RMFG-2023]
MKYVRTKHPHLFITFKNEKDQLSAIEKLNDIEYKNCKLIVKIAKPSADPFIISNQTNDNKTTIKNVKDVVTPYWNISYLEQLKLKQTNLKDTLIVKLGLLDGIENILKNMEPSPLIYGYRNKCEFTIGHLDTSKCDNEETYKNTEKVDHLVIGFRVSSYKSGCDLVAPIDECLHVSEEMKSVVKKFQTCLVAKNLPCFSCVNRSGLWKTLSLKCGSSQSDSQIMAILHINLDYFVDSENYDLNMLKEDLVTNYNRKDLGNICSFYLKLESSRSYRQDDYNPNTTFDLIHLSGCEFIIERLGELLIFNISPSSFFQVNTPAYITLLDTLIDMIKMGNQDDLKNSKTVILDLCCGTGTIGQYLAKHLGSSIHIIGIDISASSIQDAVSNAFTNGLMNTEYHCGPVEEILPSILTIKSHKTMLSKYGITNSNVTNDENLSLNTEKEGTDNSYKRYIGILDPPRKGVGRKVIDSIRNLDSLKQLIYISCDISGGNNDKLARSNQLNGALKNLNDLTRQSSKRLPGLRFTIDRVVPIDMFPLTDRYETIK